MPGVVVEGEACEACEGMKAVLLDYDGLGIVRFSFTPMAAKPPPPGPGNLVSHARMLIVPTNTGRFPFPLPSLPTFTSTYYVTDDLLRFRVCACRMQLGRIPCSWLAARCPLTIQDPSTVIPSATRSIAP